MARFVTGSLLLVLLIFLLPSITHGADTLPEPVSKQLELVDILANAKPAVVTIIATQEDSEKAAVQGSGVIISADGVVLTAWHVIEGAKSVEVRLATGVKIPVQGILGGNEENDFALLKLARTQLPVVPLGDSDKMRQGDRVLTLGTPLGMEASASDGIISAIREFSRDRKLIQTTAPVSPGSSGGPVLNLKGEVIGIAVFIMVEGQNLNFVIPTNAVKASLKTPHKLLPFTKATNEKGMKEEMALFRAGVLTLPEASDRTTPAGKKKLEKALTLFRRALTKQPDFAQAYCGVACSSFMLGRHQDALNAYKEAIRVKPDYATAHYNLGVVYGKLGRSQEALDAYKEAIRIKPDYAKAHYNLGVVYGRLDRFQDAIDAFKEAIRLKPDDAEAHYSLGVTYSNLDRFQDAIDAFKEAIRLKPDLAEAHCNLGFIYAGLGRSQDAIDAFKEAIRSKPDDARAHLGLGMTHLIMENRGGALDEYKILKGLDKDSADRLFKLIYP